MPQWLAILTSQISEKRILMQRVFVSVASLGLLLTSASILCFGQTDIEAKAAETSKALVNAHIAWRTKLSSGGASIQAKEVERREGFVKYYLVVSGLPTDELYTVMSWPVGQQKPQPIMEGVSIGKDGIVMCAARTPEQCGDPSKKDDPIDFGFNPANGEPYRLALVSGEHRAAIIVVPDPILAKDKDCTLSVERLLPGFELAYLSGSGFPPNNEATFDSESYGEKHPIKAIADNEGHIQFAVLPGVSGHQKGTTKVKGVGMKCSPSLQFDWGR
jgi:hypothetical protein